MSNTATKSRNTATPGNQNGVHNRGQVPPKQTIPANPELEEVGENEGFEGEQVSTTVPRLKGKYAAKIVKILGKRSKIAPTKFSRYIFDIQLEEVRADGSHYTGQYNCARCWKPGSEYESLASKVLGREFTPEEKAWGVKPNELKDKPFIVTVTEHRKKERQADEPESIIKIHDIHCLSEADGGAA